MRFCWCLLSLAIFLSVSAEEVVRSGNVIDWESLGTLHRGEEGDFVQAVDARGFVVYQTAGVWSNFDSIHESDLRCRFGGRIRFGEHFLFSGNVNFDPDDADPVYDSLSSVYLAWSPFGNDKEARQKFQVVAGRMKPKFTREFSTSARKIRTFERSLLVNQLRPARATGIWVEGSEEQWRYAAAIFSGDDVDEFSQFDHGSVAFAKLGYELKEDLSVGLDLMFASESQELTDAIDYSLSLSTEWNTEYDAGRWSLVTDLIYAEGLEEADGDEWGFVLIGGHLLTEKLELVARYHLANSTSDTGLRLQRRYERPAAPKKAQFGDSYQSGYLGLNYYVAGHQFKLMSGIEYSTLRGGASGFDGWTWFSGVRMYF